jgi:hypothetical protein
MLTLSTRNVMAKGNIGIAINHTGSVGTSFRQLFYKRKNPAVILSAGEQKVIAFQILLLK